MGRFRPLFFVLPFLSLLVSTPSRAEETGFVTAEGVAAIQEDAIDIARDAAVEDAQKKAVEQAVGIFLDSRIRMENFQLISDCILSQAKGYVMRYNLVDERQDSGLLRVRIKAEIALEKLSGDLVAIGIRKNKPRTLILIAEQNAGNDVRAWRREPREQESDPCAGVVENVFKDKFIEKGFAVVDRRMVKGFNAAPACRTPELSAIQARTLGDQAEAEVVITGKALARYYGEAGGGMKSMQADLSAQAVRTGTGEVLASAIAHAAAVSSSETTAGSEALKKASNQAAEEMLTRLLAAYSPEAVETRPVTITVTGLTKQQFVKFKDMLSRVRGIGNLRERGFSGTTAKVRVDSRYSVQALSDDLALRAFGGFSVKVVSSTANSLELDVVPK